VILLIRVATEESLVWPGDICRILESSLTLVSHTPLVEVLSLTAYTESAVTLKGMLSTNANKGPSQKPPDLLKSNQRSMPTDLWKPHSPSTLIL